MMMKRKKDTQRKRNMMRKKNTKKKYGKEAECELEEYEKG